MGWLIGCKAKVLPNTGFDAIQLMVLGDLSVDSIPAQTADCLVKCEAIHILGLLNSSDEIRINDHCSATVIAAHPFGASLCLKIVPNRTNIKVLEQSIRCSLMYTVLCLWCNQRVAFQISRKNCSKFNSWRK